MQTKVQRPTDTAAWKALEQRAATAPAIPDLLADPAHFDRSCLTLEELCFDFSRQRIDSEILADLLRLAEEVDLPGAIEALFGGEIVNPSEGRAALHTALRSSGKERPEAEAERERFLSFAEALRTGQRRGYGGARITRVINIGIGGSDLGPRMVTRALKSDADPVDVRYVAGLDGIELAEQLAGAKPDETFFVICSKTFTTLETRTNALAARQWLLRHLPAEAVSRHFAAVSVNDPAMDEFGIAADARFRIWDWVGGRYSVWSAIGMAAAMTIGREAFESLLRGAESMDRHFRTAPLAENIPVVSALVGIWNQNFLDCDQHVILPYDQRLDLLPDYLQQLVMESEGKSVDREGGQLTCASGVSLWGSAGSNAQHSFAQWLHQGFSHAYVDYIGTARGPVDVSGEGHLQALANMLAQAEALAHGRTAEVVRQSLDADANEALVAQKVHPGNRPSSIFLLRDLSPARLGMLLAMYEHQVYTQSVIWGINPFDQWGVELGKQRAGEYARFLLEADTDRLPGIGRRILEWSHD